MQRPVRTGVVGQSAQHREHVAERVALVAVEREVDEAQIEVAVTCPVAHVVGEQSRTPILGDAGRERVEELVEVASRLRGMGEPVLLLDQVPERVRVEDEAGARHDVRPVARLVLLQQVEPLMLLALEPDDRRLDRWRERIAKRVLRIVPIEPGDRDQPPQRRVDAAEIPEVGLVAIDVDELGDLPVARLVTGERHASPFAASRASVASPLSAMPIAQTAASRPNTAT